MITDDRGILQEFLDRNSKCLADLADMFIQMFVTSGHPYLLSCNHELTEINMCFSM